MLPIIKTPKITLLYINRTIPNIMKLKNVKITFRTCPVRKFWTREWSSIRCNKSPISFVSKKAIGNFNNLTKKSLTNEIFIRMEIWSNNQRRTKSVAVRPITIISSPNNTSQINPMSSYFMPISTIDWVRNGMISWSKHPNKRPKIIWIRFVLYCSK